MRLDTLRDKVVIITGASSGIGKLAVESFIREGAKVVLAARSIDEMQEHLMDLGMGLQHALVYEVDVSRYEQLEDLAMSVMARYGRIDVWINNAAVAIYGLIEDIEPDELSRLIDVNLKGQIYGSRVAIRCFKDQGFGNLINVSSALGKGSAPLQSVYVATKHGIVGFSSALREDLMQDPANRNIDVSVVMPASIDTPLFRHAASKTGLEPTPIPPVYPPEVAAQALVACAKDPKPEVFAGRAGKTMTLAYQLLPGLFEKYMGKTGFQLQQSDIPEPEHDDNLYAPMRGTNKIRGGFGATPGLKDYARKHPFQVAAAPLALVISLGFMTRRKTLQIMFANSEKR